MEKGCVSKIKILLVEDNQDDIELTKRAFEKEKFSNPIKIIKDGQEALDYFKNICSLRNCHEEDFPGLILLDINLPKVSGIELLKYIKNTSKLKRVPVVILTTSKRDEDIIASYDLGVNSYLQKPIAFNKFVETIRNIRLYWVLTNTPPILEDGN
jgi:DNA-binding response OmpR family regulator